MAKRGCGCWLCESADRYDKEERLSQKREVWSPYGDHEDFSAALWIENQNGYYFLFTQPEGSENPQKIMEIYNCPNCGRNLNDDWMGYYKVSIDFKDLVPQKQWELERFYKGAFRDVDWKNAKLATASFGLNNDTAVDMFEIIDTSYLPSRQKQGEQQYEQRKTEDFTPLDHRDPQV